MGFEGSIAVGTQRDDSDFFDWLGKKIRWGGFEINRLCVFVLCIYFQIYRGGQG